MRLAPEAGETKHPLTLCDSSSCHCRNSCCCLSRSSYLVSSADLLLLALSSELLFLALGGPLYSWNLMGLGFCPPADLPVCCLDFFFLVWSLPGAPRCWLYVKDDVVGTAKTPTSLDLLSPVTDEGELMADRTLSLDSDLTTPPPPVDDDEGGPVGTDEVPGAEGEGTRPLTRSGGLWTPSELESSSKLLIVYLWGTSTCFVGSPSLVGLNWIWPFLTASSSSSSDGRWRMFFWMSSRGPGLSWS